MKSYGTFHRGNLRFYRMSSVLCLLVLLLLLNMVFLSAFGAESSDGERLSGGKNLVDYEWPQASGDSSFTRYSAGPAPESSDIIWKRNITGIQSYISAFNGKIFVTSSSAVYALDRDTGDILWSTAVDSPGRWPQVYKIDDGHMVVGNACLDPETGQLLWTSASFSTNANTFGAGVYSFEEKMFFVKSQSYVKAWDFSNPSVPPSLAWQRYISGGGSVGSGVQYGDGKVFPGTYEPHQMALDAKTGNVLWDTETTAAMLFSGTYYEGKFFRGGAHDNTFYAFDANSGEILWTYNPGTYDGYWCVGSAVAYGIVYGLNKDGHLYALDADSGDLIWKYKGPGPLFFPGNPIVADGKVYATTGQQSAFDPSTGNYSHSEFVSLDAYTGQVIWRLPVEAYSPRESTAIAYGKLYLIPGYVQEQEMDKYTTINQVWAIGTTDWPMWRHDPAHTGVGGSGPQNLTLRWNFTTGGAVISSPSIFNGIVYFGSQDKNLYALDSRSGDLLWNFTTQKRIHSTPAVAYGMVYTGSEDGNVYALNASDGRLIWKKPAGGTASPNFNAAVMLRSSPVVLDGRVFVGALDNKTYCFNAYTGNPEWVYQTEGYITSSPAAVGETVYVLSQEPSSGGLYLLNASSGELIKRIEVPYQQTNRGTDLMSSPTVVGDMVFVASNKKAYYAINTVTETIQWTFKDDEADEFIIATPIYNDGQLYIIDEFFIVNLNATTGETIWKTFLGSELYVSPTYADGKLYVMTDQRVMHVLNASDGSKISYFSTPSNSWSSPTLYEGRAYVGSNDWNIYCLADYPTLKSTITIELEVSEVFTNDLVLGQGQLSPRISGADVILHLVKPDGTSTTMRITTSQRGTFDFSFAPSMAGEWLVCADWQSDKSYYSSATSEMKALQVENAPSPSPTPSPTPTVTETPTPTPSPSPTPTQGPMIMGIPIYYVYISVIVTLIGVIAVSGYILGRRISF